MATYTPIKPYGSRWNYRTPSPPPLSVIEPISPVETSNDVQIILPNPSTIINLNAANYNSTPLRQNDEPRSDSTLSLLSSVSPPSGASRRPSPATMERTKGVSEVPTFAGNQYFDPLTFFADVALSSADPTTLPKLQKLAAKDAAQRLEIPPAETSPIQLEMELAQDDQSRTALADDTLRRLSTVSSPAVGAVNASPPRSTNLASDSTAPIAKNELAPTRDLTPPSSNASITGNTETGPVSDNMVTSGISLSPRPKPDILPSPPLPRFTTSPNLDGDNAFSDSPAKRSKTMSHNDSHLTRNSTAVESSTNTEAVHLETAREELAVPSRVGRGKKRGRGGRSNVTNVDANPTTPPKKDTLKTKKTRMATPSIALRRSTRNIKYIEEPEEQVNTRHQPKAEPKHGNSGKDQVTPQRIVLHLSRNNEFPIDEGDVTTNTGGDIDTVMSSQSISEKAHAPPMESEISPTAMVTDQTSSIPEEPIGPNASDSSNKASPITEHGTLVRETSDQSTFKPDGPIEEKLSNKDKDMMSIVDEVQKQLMLNSASVSLSSSINETAANIPDKCEVNECVPVMALGEVSPVEPEGPANTTSGQRDFGNTRANPESLTVYQRESSVDAQAIVDALQQAPPPPAPFMCMSPQQTQCKLEVVEEGGSTQLSCELEDSSIEKTVQMPREDRDIDCMSQASEDTHPVVNVLPLPGTDSLEEDTARYKEQEGEIFDSNAQFSELHGASVDSEKLQTLEIVIQTPTPGDSHETIPLNTSSTRTLATEDNDNSTDVDNTKTEANDGNTVEETDLVIPEDTTQLSVEVVASPTKAGTMVMSDGAVSPDGVNEMSDETDAADNEVAMVDAPNSPQPLIDPVEPESSIEGNSDLGLNESEVQAPEYAKAGSGPVYNTEHPPGPELAEQELNNPEVEDAEPNSTEQEDGEARSSENETTQAVPAVTELPASMEVELSGVDLIGAELSHAATLGDMETHSADSERVNESKPTEDIASLSESTHLNQPPLDSPTVQTHREDSPTGHESCVATESGFIGPLTSEAACSVENTGNSDTAEHNNQPDTPPNNDLCLVCNSSTFTGNEATSVGTQSSGDATVKWIECDSCKRWTHNACVNLSNEEVDSIDKYHCAACEKEKGPSTLLRKSARAKIPIDYESLNNGSTVPVQSATNKMYHPWVDKILNGEFKTVEEKFPRVVPEELSLRFLEDGGGFKEPVVIPAAVNPYPRKSTTEGKTGNDTTGPSLTKLSSTGNDLFAYQKEPGIEVDALGMGFPNNLTVRQIVDVVGPEETVEVIDVRTQLGDKRKWTLAKWVEYFEDPNREKVYNVISLEVSKTRLARLIQRPKVVREMDLSDQVWPKDKRKEFPMVQYYCLMSVAHSYTDWHVDFGGSSVYYRILKGRKVFFFLAPTEENLSAYQKWNSSPEQHYTWLAEGRECYKIDLGPGDTMLIPSGWLHAVYTPEDSLVIGGNFLTRLHYNTQFRIHEIERACNTPIRYRYPKFARVHWYDAIKLMQEDPIPMNIDDQLISGKAANFRTTKGKGSGGNLSQHLLEGLPAVAEFLRRNSLIAQEVITEGLTKQKTEAVRGAIPKGFDDGWDTAQTFARWATWKRNCGEVIPPWAHPEADPAEGVPNAGQRKISAAAIKHAERLKADADRRAAGAVRSGLRERNQSTQRSVSRASETPAPEETRVAKKRPRLDFGEPKDSNPEPPRKKSRSQKETLDQGIIDECVDQVVEGYEDSGDAIKEAIAVEVRTQYRNVHITRLGPSRSACAPCREGKTKCVHKDEIRTLIAKVLELYHALKNTLNHDDHEENTEFLGGRSRQPSENLVAEQSMQRARTGKEATCDDTVPRASVPANPGPSTELVLNLNKVTTPKVTKKPQIKTPRSKKGTNKSSEPRRRGGKRTACDACRKSRRKCSHGLDGAPLSTEKKSRAAEEVDSDDDQSANEDTVLLDAGIAQDTSMEDVEQSADETTIPELATPSEQLQKEQDDVIPQEHQSTVIEVDQIQPISLDNGVEEAFDSPSHENVPQALVESTNNSLESKGTDQDAHQFVKPNITNLPSRGKRKRAVDSEERYVTEKIAETKQAASTSHRKLPVTPSPSGRRVRSTVPVYDESRESPKRQKVDEVEASPKGNKNRNTPEKQAWQEMKAAEFGFRKRSKSKSSS